MRWQLRKLKQLVGLTGWLVVLTFLGLALLSLKYPAIVDGILWRYEILEDNPTVGQRIFEKRSHIQNMWEDKNIGQGAVILLGDSHLRLLPKSKVPYIYNFAIGGQTIGRMTSRIQQFQSLQNAALIVVNGGENDLSEDRSVSEVLEKWQNFLTILRGHTASPILCVGLPQSELNRVHKEMIIPLNLGIARLCGSVGAEFLALNLSKGNFEKADLSADKMHLSISAMRILANEIDNFAIKARAKKANQ